MKRLVPNLVLVGLLSVATHGCRDDFEAGLMLIEDLEVAQLSTGIHPVLEASSGSAGRASVRLHLVLVDVGNDIASYQGELSWDPSRLALVDGEGEPSVLGAWNQIRPGLVRFAGIAPDGLSGRAVLQLELEGKGSLRGSDFRVVLEELRGVQGLADLMAWVSADSTPHLTAQRMDG